MRAQLPRILAQYKWVQSLARAATKKQFAELFIPTQNSLVCIAEIKKRSPSAGVFVDVYTTSERAQLYARGGADAISLVTNERFFGGSYESVREVRALVDIPVLMKDFIIDIAQIELAARLGAHALLLITAILTPSQLQEYITCCQEYGIDPVVEVYDENELCIALDAGAQIIAVNARDLRTFEIDIDRACALGACIPPEKTYLAFSGVQTSAEVGRYRDSGARGVLVGSTLMQSKDIPLTLRSLQISISYEAKT